MFRAISLVVVVMLATSAGAQSRSATIADMRKWCAAFNAPTTANEWQRLACVAFIQGFGHGYAYGQRDEREKGAAGRLCAPNGVNPSQVAAVFVKWANANPTEWHKEASTGIWHSMQEAWSCR